MDSASSTLCTVAILNYNGEGWLRKFLPGVLANSPGAQILVYDNASTDNSLAFLATLPQVQTVRGTQNLGFCAGYNKAFESVTTPYAILLNSDVEVTPGWLAPLLARLQANPKLAAIQPKILSYHSKALFEYAGAAGGFVDRWGYPFCRGRIFSALEADEGQYDQDTTIFWGSGACLAVQTSVFKTLGGFDERFFAHMEEIDWCWRAQRAGYQIGYTSAATVYHVGGGTLSYDSPRKLYLNYRNNLLMLANNLRGINLFSTIGARLLLDGISALHLALSGKPSAILNILKAHFAFYSLAFKKSKRVANAQVVKLAPFSIVWAFFVQKKRKFSELGL